MNSKLNKNISIYNGEVTVKKLIKQLQKLPENWTVSIMGCTDFYTNVVVDKEVISYDEVAYFNAFGDCEYVGKRITELTGVKFDRYSYSNPEDEDDTYVIYYFKPRYYGKISKMTDEICELVEYIVGFPVCCDWDDKDVLYPKFASLTIEPYHKEK